MPQVCTQTVVMLSCKRDFADSAEQKNIQTPAKILTTTYMVVYKVSKLNVYLYSTSSLSASKCATASRMSALISASQPSSQASANAARPRTWAGVLSDTPV